MSTLRFKHFLQPLAHLRRHVPLEQRHRLHRIQYSRQASSRLTDLTSMVSESFRTSFRRVNVAGEADSEKASPAAARPAARPQLSWRASAPEYGTFES